MAAKRLWDKGEELNEMVHRFTVGNDPEIDLHLVHADAVGSAAQAKMLQKVGLLTAPECAALLAGLRDICRLSAEGKFVIPAELEDCHTAIEEFLVKAAGEAGKKIHTGRSRNDQVLLAMRLYMRQQAAALLRTLCFAAERLIQRTERDGSVPMPGYTHFQPAMPASIGLWLHAFAEGFLEVIADGLILLERLNANPLGAGSGFGVNLPLDREYVTKLLAFSRTQRSPIDVQNSRGRFELKFIRWCVDIAGLIEKLAWDLVLYSTHEFGFFSLPTALTTGSSIMPQKHNPDVLELLRGRAAKVRAAELELLLVTAKLPSHYHRDFQYTKEPVIRAAGLIGECLPVISEVVVSFTINEDRLRGRMIPELYATYDAFREVRNGLAFRDAYRHTAERVKSGTLDTASLAQDFQLIEQQLAAELSLAKQELSEARNQVDAWTSRILGAEKSVLD